MANGANEETVKLFLDRKISFTDIGDLVWDSMSAVEIREIETLQDVLDADLAAREFVRRSVSQ